MKSYDYAHRKGVLPITWEDFADLTIKLVEQIEAFQPEIILGVARAGLFPATLAAGSLRCEFFPVRLTRRVNDEVVYSQPVWKTPIPAEVTGKRVVVIDEIADAGQTLALVKEAVLSKGAARVITATLFCHSWADPRPDFIAQVTDELVIFPWDRRVRVDGKWQIHPEIAQALAQQGLKSDEV